jgi:UDP-3-O-[3-hydroxymyristoyl] N-acetylglucosamine deacetylase
MDGLPQTFSPDANGTELSVPEVGLFDGAFAESSTRGLYQNTLKNSIGCVGVGLHSGHRVQLHLRPAPAGTGIVFRRTDLPGAPDIAARYDNVFDTRLCTLLAAPGQPEVQVGTVEHVMAALAATGIDNALVELDGPEVPILDGSAAPFVFLVECAGIAEQAEIRPVIEVMRTVRVENGEGFAELRPGTDGLDMALTIDFPAAAIGRQALALRLSAENFRRELASARTFAFAHEIAQLRASGRAKGGSLDNALVVDGGVLLNPGGLRMPEEFVRHKMLDAVGDLALAGAPLRGRLIANRPGHALNNSLLRALFSDPRGWRIARPAPAGWMPVAA